MGWLDLEILTFQFKPKVEFFKPEVDTQTHKNIFLESDDHADYKNIFCFEIEAKLRTFAKICTFCKFWSAILNT